MKKILFNRSERAFLPEVDAYIKYINKRNDFVAYDSSKLLDYKLNDFDVIWEFKGLGGIDVENQILVHEYASLSTGKFPQVKNFVKSRRNIKPDLRIFLNENVKEGFYFNDNTEFCFRDMGIDKMFFEQSEIKKEYDYVYVGPIVKERELDKFLEKFVKKDNGKLCLIGNVDEDIYNSFKNNKNLTFTGKVPYAEVPKIASKAVYGINYIPDKYPFNVQTSTKLLEYLAMGLKVITTDYKWIREFENRHNCAFYKLNYSNLEFDRDDIEKHNFISNFKSEEYLWDDVIEKSNVINKLKYKMI